MTNCPIQRTGAALSGSTAPAISFRLPWPPAMTVGC